MNDKAREILNGTGFPFQHHCAEVIGNVDGYEVSQEVPYTDPPTNAALLGVHGQIDILAVRPDVQNELLMCFVIECKRASEKIKNWILIPNKKPGREWPTIIFLPGSHGQTLQIGAIRNVQLPDLGYRSGGDFNYCINGIELNTDMRAINRDPAEKIFRPLQQVAHGAHAFETMRPKIVEGIEYFRNPAYSTLVVLPVIVTTAMLFIAEFSPADVRDGDIQDGGLNLGALQSWVTYEFPLPDYLGYSFRRTKDSSTSIGKRTVFIVNEKHLREFFHAAPNFVFSTAPPAVGKS